MKQKVLEIIQEYETLLEELSTSYNFEDQNASIKKQKRLSTLEKLYSISTKIIDLEDEIEDAKNILLETTDSEEKLSYIKIITSNQSLLDELYNTLSAMLNTNLNKIDNCVLEIRSGTGGDESSLFTKDLLRMYTLFINKMGWQINIESASENCSDGIKEVTCTISGDNCYSLLKYESGVHRVQRVPVTESSGRIHTSASSVVIYPVVEITSVEINPTDIEIFTYRSSGPGGQSVNTTDSAVRITHKPTGITVTCQDRKSQLKNKEQALKILASKLHDIQSTSDNDNVQSIRKLSIKTGDRSDKIKTYNFPQDRLTDHRLKKSWHNLDSIMNGELYDILSSVNSNLELL